MVFQINVPDTVQLSEFEVPLQLAMLLFDRGALTSGQGAEMVGISKRSFLELAGKYGVSIFQYTDTELLKELETIGERP